MLQTSGLKTGLYTSPHIASFRERIQVNGKYISANDVEEILPDVFAKCDANNIPATFFEVTTALAFRKFVESNCDVVVLEVGLGGRLDATNVIKKPALSVITSIQYDHQATLGKSLEDIATEKGGIIKSDSVYGVLVGPGCPHEVLQQITFDVNKSLNYYQLNDESLLLPEDRVYPLSGASAIPPSGSGVDAAGSLGIVPRADIDGLNTDIARSAINILSGDNYFYQRNNDVVDDSYILIRRYQMLNDSLAALKPDQLTQALSIRPPCRFERMQASISEAGKLVCRSMLTTITATPGTAGANAAVNYPGEVEIVLDLAHNQGAIISLLEKLAYVYSSSEDSPPVVFRFVVGMAADKDVRACVEAVKASGIIGTGSATGPSRPGNTGTNTNTGQIYCVEALHPRALGRAQLQEIVRDVLGERVGETLSEPEQKVENVAITLQKLVRQGLKNQAEGGPKEVVVVMGTAYIMADCKKALSCYDVDGGKDLIDDFELY